MKGCSDALACVAVTRGFSRPNAFTHRLPPVGHEFLVERHQVGLHHERDEKLRRVAEFHAVKALLRDPHHRHAVVVDQDVLADNLPVGGKNGVPVVIAQHYKRMAAGNLVVIRCERAPRGGGHAEHREIRPRNQFRLDPLRGAIEGHTDGARESAEHFGEDLVVLFEVLVHGVGNRVASPIAAIVPAPHG